jgi:hypothetical protein
MITKQIKFITLAITLIFITSGKVFADPKNDKYIFPAKSQFSKILHSKIDRNLISTNSKEIFGLKNLEKKKINDYGIEIGNNFSSIVENIDVIFEKTSADLKITVEKTYGRLIFLKYMDSENIEKENLNKGTVKDNI